MNLFMDFLLMLVGLFMVVLKKEPNAESVRSLNVICIFGDYLDLSISV